MKLLLHTATPTCTLLLVDDEQRIIDASWEAGRELAHGLLSHIHAALAQEGKDFTDLSGIGVYQGPGSFTGLRIALAVVNTIAHEQAIPIVGVTGDDWREQALKRLSSRETDRLVLPLYDRPANITAPRK